MATVVEVLAKLKADTGDFKRGMSEAQGSMDDLNKSVKDGTGLYQDSAGKWRNASGQFASGAELAAAGIGGATAKMEAFRAKTEKVGQGLSKTGKSLTRSVTLPLVALGTAAVYTATQFESSMSKIVGLVGIAADEVDGMRDSVLALAGQTAKSPQELADALFVVTSAGLRGEDALGALESAAQASAAGLGDTADIARALAGAMNAYGADVLSAAEATDVIVATARAGNFETSQFAGAIGRVLPFAKQAQASFADMGGAVALLTRTNGDAAQSVTQMAALFRAFVVPTRQAQKVLTEVGLSAQDVRDSIGERGLVPTLQMLDEQLGGNREKLGRLLGSSEAAAAAFQILDADADTLADTFGAVNNAAGITAEAFGVVEETTGFKLQRAMTNFKVILIEIGDILAPLVQKVADFATKMLGMFQGLPDGAKKAIVALAGIAAAIGPVLLISGKLLMGISGVLKVLGGAGGLAGALAALTGPVGIVIAAVAGLIAIIVAMWRESEIFRDAVMNAFNSVRDAISGAIDTIKGALSDATPVIDALRLAFKILGDYVGKVLIPVWSFILTKAIWVVSNLIAGLIRYINLLVSAFRIALPYILNFAAEIVKGFARMVDGALGAIEMLLGGLATVAGLIGLGGPLREAQANVAEFRATVASNFQAAEDAVRGAAEGVERSSQGASDAMEDYRDAAVRARGATEEYRDAAVRAAEASGGMITQQEALANVTDAATTATLALNEAYAGLLAFFSETAAMDRAHKLLQDMQKQVSSNQAGFDGYSDAAMANRDIFGQWAQAQIRAAESLTDPQERLAALQRVQEEARDALLGQGFTPEQSDYYNSITDLVSAAEEEVGKLGNAVDVARDAGHDVASAVAQGIAQGMSQQSAAINGAGLLAGDEVSDGLHTSLDIGSPSKVAMRAGRNTGIGLVKGLQDFNLSIQNGGFLSGAALIDGMIAGLEARSGSLYARVRAIVAAAIAAANAAAGSRPAPAAPPPTGGGTSPTSFGPRSDTSITVNVTAAPGEPASSSVPRALRRAAFVGGLDG